MSCEPDAVACLLTSSPHHGLVVLVERAGACVWVSRRACPSRLIVLLFPSGGAFIPVSSWRLVPRLGERGGFCFSSYPDGERMDCGSRLVVSGLMLACLRCRRGDEMMPCSSSAFPPVSYHSMAAGRGACAVSSFGSSSPASCSPLAIALASCRSFDLMRRDERRDGGLLGYRGAARRGSSMSVYNEYDVCDVYKRYKDTRIRGYDGYIW